MNTIEHQLSGGARQILDNVKDAMQAAEELGGVDDTADYIHLMDYIIGECIGRIAAASAAALEAALEAATAETQE